LRTYLLFTLITLGFASSAIGLARDGKGIAGDGDVDILWLDTRY